MRVLHLRFRNVISSGSAGQLTMLSMHVVKNGTVGNGIGRVDCEAKGVLDEVSLKLPLLVLTRGQTR